MKLPPLCSQSPLSVSLSHTSYIGCLQTFLSCLGVCELQKVLATPVPFPVLCIRILRTGTRGPAPSPHLLTVLGQSRSAHCRSPELTTVPGSAPEAWHEADSQSFLALNTFNVQACCLETPLHPVLSPHPGQLGRGHGKACLYTHPPC